MLDVWLGPEASAVGQKLSDLALPQNVVIAALYRNDELLTPRGNLIFETGDHIFMITNDEDAGVPSVFTRPHRAETMTKAKAPVGEVQSQN